MSFLKHALFTAIGGPLGGIAYALTASDDDEKERPTSEAISKIQEAEHERLQRLIEDGRRRGVSEIEIEISADLAKSLSGNASAAYEGSTAGLGFQLDDKGNGKTVLRVKYLELQVTDKLRELQRLHQEGVLTEAEFAQAKARMLATL